LRLSQEKLISVNLLCDDCYHESFLHRTGFLDEEFVLFIVSNETIIMVA